MANGSRKAFKHVALLGFKSRIVQSIHWLWIKTLVPYWILSQYLIQVHPPAVNWLQSHTHNLDSFSEHLQKAPNWISKLLRRSQNHRKKHIPGWFFITLLGCWFMAKPTYRTFSRPWPWSANHLRSRCSLVRQLDVMSSPSRFWVKLGKLGMVDMSWYIPGALAINIPENQTWQWKQNLHVVRRFSS